MTLTHLHLLLNHVPTVGAAVALVIVLMGYIRRNEHLKHIGLEVVFVIALVTLPVYVSGAGAHRELRNHAEIADVAVRMHQDAALWGMAITEFAGFAAWLALWQTRRNGRPGRGLVPATTVLLLLSLAVMARAANLGGEIRHPEIVTAQAEGGEAAPAPARQFMVTAISRYMTNDSRWAWPAAEAVHFLGMSLSIGVLLAVNLRILGVMRRVPFAEVHRLLPWGLLGLGVNLITGMLFFVSTPSAYVLSAPFFWKVLFLMIAGANFLYLTVVSKAWTADGLDARFADKLMAVSSIVAWLAVLYAGRMLPFLGFAF